MKRPPIQFFSKQALSRAFTWSTAAHVAIFGAALGLGYLGAEQKAEVALEETVRFTSDFDPAPTPEVRKAVEIPNPPAEPEPEFVDPDDAAAPPELPPLAEPESLQHRADLPPLPQTSTPLSNRTTKRPKRRIPKTEAEPAPRPPDATPPTKPTPPPVGAFVSARRNQIGCPKPVYPKRAIRRGLEGRCILAIRVTAAGSVESVRIRKSSGHGILDRAAIAAVQKWRLTPATHGGRPIASERDVSILFKPRHSKR